MRVLRVGIIGQGRSGRDIHGEYLKTVPDRFKIVLVADTLKDRCRLAEKEYGCQSTTDWRDMLKRRDLDLIVNTAPSHLHVPMTQHILRSGHHVLCDKPLAQRASQVDRLIATAKKHRRMLAIFQQSRFSPVYEQVGKVIASGVLGRIVMIKANMSGFARRWDWQTLREYGGGSLSNTGPHVLDQVLMLFDPKLSMPEVWCRFDWVNTFGDAEDHVKLLLSGRGKPSIDVEVSCCSAYPLYNYQVYGCCGGLTATGTEVKWTYFDPKKAPRRRLIRTPLPGRAYCGEKLPWQEERWEQPKDFNIWPYMCGRVYGNLYDAITTGAPLAITPQQVRRQIAVIEECQRQNRNAGPRKR